MSVALTIWTAWGSIAEAVEFDGTVVVLRPTDASPAARGSLARIADELSADRLHVVSVEVGDSSRVIEDAGADREGTAVVALFGDPDGGQAEIWVVERVGGRTAARRALVAAEDSRRMPELLALRALELLRATSLELSLDHPGSERARPSSDMAGPIAPKASAPAGTTFVPAPVTERSPVGVDLGVAFLASLAGPAPAVVPIGRLRVPLSNVLYARASVAGLGSRPRVQTTYGSATVSQNVGLIEVGALFRADKRVRPNVSVGVGALSVDVLGVGSPPYLNRESARWSAAFAGGAGIAVALRAHVALTSELQVLVATPHPTVRFVDIDAASVGFPSLLLTVGVQVTL